MKIAVITDDGKTISRHFGRASHYMVVTIEDGKVSNTEMRAKMGHTHFGNQSHGSDPNKPHGFDPESQQKHNSMAETISDCEALICGGMGRGAYVSMESLNIRPFVTEIVFIEDAVAEYIDGTLADRTEMLH